MKKLLKFLLGGKTLPTATPAEQRYKGGTRTHRVLSPSIPLNDSTTVDAVEAKKPWFGALLGYILRAIDHSAVNPSYNDTTYMEVPTAKSPFVKLKTRGIRKLIPIGGGHYYQTPYYFFGIFSGNGKSRSAEDALEFQTMKKRFNTAWNVASKQDGGTFESMSSGQRMDLEDQAMRLMPKGWGDPDGWLNKFLKAKGIPREEQVTAEQVMAALNGDKLPQGGSNKSNRFTALPIKQIPEITVNGIDRRWRYDRRQQDHGNGHKVISDTFFDYYDGGNRYLGDLAPIRGGRTIYVSPKGNDTLYWNQPEKWINFADGFMPVGKNQPGAKRNFFKNLKRPLIRTQLHGGPAIAIGK